MLLSVLIHCMLFSYLLASDAPVIGILTQEPHTVEELFPEEYDSYIAASYVKFVEGSGGRVVPVWIGQNESYYKWVVNNTNGLLLPGGGAEFNQPHGYGAAAVALYKYAKEANDAGTYYPILGICLGFEVLAYAAVQGETNDTIVGCYSKFVSLPLEFTPGFRESRLFSTADDHIIEILKTKNVTFNNHHYCLTDELLEKLGIRDEWSLLSYDLDERGFKFISSMEHKVYPFYGLQYHPEKNIYEFKKNSPKSREAVEVSQFIGNFFLDECRSNNQKFLGAKLNDVLIWNYSPIYVGYKKNSNFEQLYMFKQKDYKKPFLEY